jgi:hypothetical protein
LERNAVRKVIIGFAAAACLVPALALAATPAKNSSFAYCESKNMCPFGFETNKSGKRIKDIKLYAKCSPVPVMDWGKIRVKDSGRFKKSGTATDVLDRTIEFTIKGRFKKPKKAVGTYLVERNDCNDQEQRFVAKKVGKAQPNG